MFSLFRRLFQNPIGLIMVLFFFGVYALLFGYAARKDRILEPKVNWKTFI